MAGRGRYNSGMATRFSDRLSALSTGPGVYLMKNAAGDVIYVGKAASLRSRVRSYFQGSRLPDPKTRELVSQIADFDVIRTDTASEALILENELIKRYQPRYNVRLKDNKTYPYIKITNEEWPRVISTRRIVHDGGRYFGPYTSAGSVHRTLDLLNRLFPYRPCDITITGDAPRPCLYFHMGRCLGPCIGAADPREYDAAIEGAALFLQGRGEELVPDLRQRMEQAAEDLDFERAAKLRDEISAIEHVLERQKIVSGKGDDADVIAVYQSPGGDSVVQVAMIRNGKILGSEHFVMSGTRVDDDPSEIVASFVAQFYADAAVVPAELVVQHLPADDEILRGWLAERRGGRVRLTVPQRGEKRKLVEMVAKSAAENFEQTRLRWLNDEQRMTAALTELADALELAGLPRRIECFDISTLQGTNMVASMVVFEDGRPKKSDYRRFSIKSVDGQNDRGAKESSAGASSGWRPSRTPRRGRASRTWSSSTAARGSSTRRSRHSPRWGSRRRSSAWRRRTRRSSCPASRGRSCWTAIRRRSTWSSACETRRTASRCRSIARSGSGQRSARPSTTCGASGPSARRR